MLFRLSYEVNIGSAFSFFFKKLTRIVPVIILIAILFFLASQTGEWRAASLDSAMRGDLMRRIVAVASAISPEVVKGLSFTAADKDTVACAIVKEQMQVYADRSLKNNIYSLAQIGDQFVFGPETIPENSAMTSAPGTVYEKPTEDTWFPFQRSRPIVSGPNTDEYGTFVSALAPVVDPLTGKVLMIVGVDIPVTEWQGRLDFAQHEPLWLVAYAVFIIFAIIFLAEKLQARGAMHTLSLRGWIVGPVFLVMLAGLLSFGNFHRRQAIEEARQDSEQCIVNTENNWNQLLLQKAKQVSLKLDLLLADSAALKNGLNGNFASFRQLFQRVFAEENLADVSQMHLFSADRQCLYCLRGVCSGDDHLMRGTVKLSQRSGVDIWGLEQGTCGELAFRYVRPVGQAVRSLVLLRSALMPKRYCRSLELKPVIAISL